VLALELGCREPHFTLVLEGEPLLTSAAHTAPFHMLLLLLHVANTESGARGTPRAGAAAPLHPVLVPWHMSFVMSHLCYADAIAHPPSFPRPPHLTGSLASLLVADSHWVHDTQGGA